MTSHADFPAPIGDAYKKLTAILAEYGSMMIAYSGGVDSGFLAYVANQVLGVRAVPVIGISDSLPKREEAAAIAFLDHHAIAFKKLNTYEMENAAYRENQPNRCYFCKSELFTKLNALANADGFRYIAYGANLDDRGDHRPGAIAAGEQRVIAPLVEAGFTKHMIREASKALGLSLWDKPAAPCMASRVPYFSEVTPEKLAQIEAAENFLKDLGFLVCRVRHHGEMARIEIPTKDYDRLHNSRVWGGLVNEFKKIGFDYVTLNRDGFRSGRLNDVLTTGAGAPKAH